MWMTVLKSVENPKNAVILKNEVDMVKSDGLHLMNVIYNNRDLLMSYLEDQRRNSIKNADLIGNFPTEKALVIQWKISKDSFAFNIKVTTRPLIKIKLLSIISSICNLLGLARLFVFEERQLLQTLCNQNVQWNDVAGSELRKFLEKW